MLSPHVGQRVMWRVDGEPSLARVLRVIEPGACANVKSPLVYIELDDAAGRVTVYAHELEAIEEEARAA